MSYCKCVLLYIRWVKNAVEMKRLKQSDYMCYSIVYL